MYVKITNGIPEKYSIGQLYRDNPQTSFPDTISDTLLAEYDVYPLTLVPQPQYDQIAQNLIEATPTQINGVWTQVWIIQPASTDEIEQKKADVIATLKSQRADAYREEADPLFFKAQRGEVDIAEWEAKVQEIKDRFPYPTI